MTEGGGVVVGVLIMVALIIGGLAFGPYHLEPNVPVDISHINFTVIDKDESDFSVYTDASDILATNKYQWRRLEVNKTYSCELGFVNRFYNCTEVHL